MSGRWRVRVAIALVALAVSALIAGAPPRFAGAAPTPRRPLTTRSAPRAATAPSPTPPPARYRDASEPYAFNFPRDHASHPEFRTEWWYYTGELSSGKRAFGFELTFFRVGIDRARESSRSAWAPHTLILAHAALTDETHRTFHYDELIERPALGLAGADTARYRVWAGDWSVGLGADGRTHLLRAAAKDFGLRLDLVPRKAPVLHGKNGVSRKGSGAGEASHYASITRLAARGAITVDGDTLPVSGEAWMDHEFSSSVLAPNQQGWDWFALRLADGRDLMLYSLRLAGGGIEPQSSGTLVAADGTTTHLTRDEFEIAALRQWKSPRSGATYPQGWRVRVPRHGIDLVIEPTVADQELVTRSTGGVTYWEGSVRVSGAEARVSGAEMRAGVSGRGYVELTGYTGPPPGR